MAVPNINRLQKTKRKLYAGQIPDARPVVILAYLGKAKYFSTIDLESGFHQILVKDSDIKKKHFLLIGDNLNFNEWVNKRTQNFSMRHG